MAISLNVKQGNRGKCLKCMTMGSIVDHPYADAEDVAPSDDRWHFLDNLIEVYSDKLSRATEKWGIFSSSFAFKAVCMIDIGLIATCFVINNCIESDSLWINQQQINSRLTEFYVPCNLVSLSVEEDLKTFDSSKHDVKLYQDVNGTRICAFSNITAVIEKATERIARQRVAEGRVQPKYLSCGNFSNKPHGGQHIAFFSKLDSNNRSTEQTGSRDEILKWTNYPSNSFVGNGISYTNGRISVDIGQFYFVYVSVAFNKSSMVSSKSGFRSPVFILDIVTAGTDNGVEYATRNLQFVETLSDYSDAGFGVASLGSHVYLDRRDVLYVSVSDGERVLHGSRGNAFGIYAT